MIQVGWARGADRFPRLHWALEREAWAVFSRYGVLHELTAHEDVFRHREGSDALFLVLEGEIVIRRDGEELARVGPNHSFGEMGLLLGRPRSADAEAATDARLLELSRRDIERMMTEEPVWAARLYRVLAECLAEYLEKASEGPGAADLTS